jgi:hypothetical protein
MSKIESRTYNPSECAVFCKTKDPFGGFSNMSGEFGVFVSTKGLSPSTRL